MTLNKLFSLADEHGNINGDPDYTIGDLQCLIRLAVAIFTPEQKKAFFESDDIKSLVEVMK